MRAVLPPTLRKLSWTLLLPLLLLFAQQGELRHEYSHDVSQEASCKKPLPTDTCATCLAYAHITAAAKTELALAGLLANLSFHFAPAFAVASADDDLVSPRSRGPPSL
jgi:hypothetical protein